MWLFGASLASAEPIPDPVCSVAAHTVVSALQGSSRAWEPEGGIASVLALASKEQPGKHSQSSRDSLLQIWELSDEAGWADGTDTLTLKDVARQRTG